MTRWLGAASGSWNLSSGEAQNRANVVHEFRSRPHIERAFLALKKNAVQIHRAGTAGVRLARTFLQRVVAELRYGPSIASLKFLALAARPFASHWNARPI